MNASCWSKVLKKSQLVGRQGRLGAPVSFWVIVEAAGVLRSFYSRSYWRREGSLGYLGMEKINDTVVKTNSALESNQNKKKKISGSLRAASRWAWTTDASWRLRHPGACSRVFWSCRQPAASWSGPWQSGRRALATRFCLREFFRKSRMDCRRRTAGSPLTFRR